MVNYGVNIFINSSPFHRYHSHASMPHISWVMVFSYVTLHLHIIVESLHVTWCILSCQSVWHWIWCQFSPNSYRSKVSPPKDSSVCTSARPFPWGWASWTIPMLINILWQRNGTVFIVLLHYVHVTKRQGSWLTPAQLPSLRGASGSVFREVSGLCKPGIRTRDLRIPSSPPCPCCHQGCKDIALKAWGLSSLTVFYYVSLLFCLSVSYYILCP